MSDNPNGPGPGAGADPNEPTSPYEPNQPAQPAEPAQPTEPAQPAPPSQPAQPVQPTEPPTAPPAQPGGYPPPAQQQPYGQQPPSQPGAYPPPGGYPPPGQQPPAYGQQAPGAYPPPPGSFPTAPPESGTTQPAWATGAPVTVGQAVSYGWSKFWSNAGIWIAAVLVVAVIAFVINLIFSASIRAYFQQSSTEDLQQRLDDARGFGNVLLAAIGSILSYIVLAFLVSGALATTYKGRAAFGDFFRLRNFWQIVLLAVVVGVLSFVLGYVPVLGALILLVVEFFLTFALYFVIDAGQDTFTAIRSSFGVVSKNPGVVIVLILAVIGISILGALVCGVGLLAAVPIGLLAYAFAYRRLTGGTPV